MKADDDKYIIDLRSDTVTLPTEEMLEAIKNAKLGDDGYREDPTVNRLEEMAAKKMGKEAALLVPSGTMANLVSVMTNTKRGDSVILEAESHIYWHELGSISAIAGVLPIPVRGEMGVMKPEDVEAAIRPPRLHQAETTLICIENTHNRAGGTIMKPSQIEAISKVVKTSRKLVQEYGRKPSLEEIAQRLDLPVEKVAAMLKAAQEPVSLDRPLGNDEESRFLDFVEDKKAESPARSVAILMLQEQLEKALTTLTQKEEKVIRLRFGLGDGRPRTLEEIGAIFNLTRERVRQIEAKALQKLRHPSRAENLRRFFDLSP